MNEVYSIIVLKDGATPPDVSRGDVINVWASWDLVEGLAKLALARYPGADRAIAVDSMGHTRGEWSASAKTNQDRLDVWHDGSAICVIAVGSHGDPLDLGEAEVVEMIAKLQAALAEERR
jgi:hypothetical protein